MCVLFNSQMYWFVMIGIKIEFDFQLMYFWNVNNSHSSHIHSELNCNDYTQFI